MSVFESMQTGLFIISVVFGVLIALFFIIKLFSFIMRKVGQITQKPLE